MKTKSWTTTDKSDWGEPDLGDETGAWVYRDLAYMQNQCRRLARQIKERSR